MERESKEPYPVNVQDHTQKCRVQETPKLHITPLIYAPSLVCTYCIQSGDEFWANLFTGKSKSGSKYPLKFSLLETSCAHVLGSGTTTTTTTTLLYKTKEIAAISMCKLQNIRISSLE